MRFNWKGALGIVLGAALLWWSLRGESLGDIWLVARSADGLKLVLMVVSATAVFPLRAMRWAVILEPMAAVPLGPLWRCTAIGAMGNNLLPARAGEFARAFTVSREVPGISFATALGSLALDRIVDVTAVALLFFAALPLSDFSPSETILGVPLTQVMRIATVLATVPLLLIAFLAIKPALFESAASAVLRRMVPAGLHARLMRILTSVIGGVAAVRSPSRLARIMAHALLMWLTTALSFWIGFQAVGIEVPFAAALLVQGIIAFAVALPATPGFVGIFEAAAVVGLALYGVSRELAVSFALLYHVLTFLPITVIGLYYFGRLGLRFRDIGEGEGLGLVSLTATVLAQAKVNLFLRVLAREASGYHQLETLFCRLALGDVVRVQSTAGPRSLDFDGPALPRAGLGPREHNLAWRAAEAFRNTAHWPAGFSIEIEKTIPVGAGLGGGSADAGAVLRALNTLCPTPLAPATLLRLAAELGADVPFLTQDSNSLALAWGRGDRTFGLPALPSRLCLVVVPPFAIATKDAYRWLAESRDPTPGSARHWQPSDFASWERVVAEAHNDFEDVVFTRHPELGALVRDYQPFCDLALLSGSGSAVFLLPRPTAVMRPTGEGYQVLRTETASAVSAVELSE